jgi:type I restriction enzyme S subunit
MGQHGLELLSLYTDIGVKPRKELEARGNKATTTDGYLRVRVGDMVVNKLLAWMGAIAASGYDGVTSPAYDILRPVRPVNVWYYHHLFRCGLYPPILRLYSRGIMDMRNRLYFDAFGRIPIPYPPIEHQDQIVADVQSSTTDIDKARQQSQSEIELMTDYRTTLIAEAVCGRLDVRREIELPLLEIPRG